MKRAEFSFALPVLNGAKTLARALASLQMQSVAEIEIVVVDNGSDDSTPLIARYFASHDSRIRFVRGDRVDVNTNFARALENVQTDFVAWAAHDDVWHPNFVQVCLEQLRSERQIVIPNWWIGNLDSKRGKASTPNPLSQIVASDSTQRLFTFLNLPLQSHKANIVYSAFQRNYLADCQERQSMADDGAFSAVAIYSAQPAVVDQVIFYKHFPHEDWKNWIHKSLFKLSKGKVPRGTARDFAKSKEAALQSLAKLWPQWSDLFEQMYSTLPLFSNGAGAVSDKDLAKMIMLARARVEEALPENSQ